MRQSTTEDSFSNIDSNGDSETALENTNEPHPLGDAVLASIGVPGAISDDPAPHEKAEIRAKTFYSLAETLENEIKRLGQSPKTKTFLYMILQLQHKYHDAQRSQTRTNSKNGKDYPVGFEEVEKLLRTAPPPERRPWISGESHSDRDSGDEKYESKPRRKRQKLSASSAPVNRKTAPMSVSEEDTHSWSVTSQTRIPSSGQLWRVWDSQSVSKIEDPRVGFLSGAAQCFLGSKENRALTITYHANFGCRRLTPYISTTESSHEIATIRIPALIKRQLKKHPDLPVTVKITLINARARVAAKMPIIKMLDEIAHYQVKAPYDNVRGKKNSFFDREYLLLFRVPPQEIVRTFALQEIKYWMKENHGVEDWPVRATKLDIEIWIDKNSRYIEAWADTVGQSAYDQHEEARTGQSTDFETNYTCCGHGDGCSCCGHVVKKLAERDASA
ncbi:hypothetical protein EAF00_002387 [Botryotinia globosa]|nr:hypothetical protein EAF00_002387 [Botryotinia globosa]